MTPIPYTEWTSPPQTGYRTAKGDILPSIEEAVSEQIDAGAHFWPIIVYAYESVFIGTISVSRDDATKMLGEETKP